MRAKPKRFHVLLRMPAIGLIDKLTRCLFSRKFSRKKAQCRAGSYEDGFRPTGVAQRRLHTLSVLLRVPVWRRYRTQTLVGVVTVPHADAAGRANLTAPSSIASCLTCRNCIASTRNPSVTE